MLADDNFVIYILINTIYKEWSNTLFSLDLITLPRLPHS